MNNYQKTKKELENLQSLLNKNEQKFFYAFEHHDSKSLEDSIDWGLPFEDSGFIDKFKSLTFKKKKGDRLLEFLKTSEKLYEVSPHFYHLFFEKLDSMACNWLEKIDFKEYKNYIFADFCQWLVANKKNNNFSFSFLETLKHDWGRFPIDPNKHTELENFILPHLKSPSEMIVNLSKHNNKEIVSYYLNKYNSYFISEEEKEKTYDKSLKKSIENLNIEVIEFWLEKGVSLPEVHNVYAHIVQQMSKADNYFSALDLIITKDSKDKAKHFIMEEAIFINRKETIEHVIKNHYYKKDEDKVKEFLKKVKKEEIKEIIQKAFFLNLLDESLDKKETNKIKMKI